MEREEQDLEKHDSIIIKVLDFKRVQHDEKLVICKSEDLDYEPSETPPLLLAKDFDIDW
jgi:hypothetical protein